VRVLFFEGLWDCVLFWLCGVRFGFIWVMGG
jgi:hypothetical protein